MNFKQIIQSKSDKSWQLYIPNLSIDCVVFGFQEGSLKILLTKMLDHNLWSLPGGYVLKTENLIDAGQRILFERTGAKNIYLEQFGVFGNLNRSESFFDDFDDGLWNKQRFISIGFYALVDFTSVNLIMDDISDGCAWHDISQIPDLIMDHSTMLDNALKTLRTQMIHKPIGLNLLPLKFTIPELQKLYEIVLGKTLNRGNFYRKMGRYDILKKLDESRKGGAHKAPDLYQFDTEKYHEALKNGLSHGW